MGTGSGDQLFNKSLDLFGNSFLIAPPLRKSESHKQLIEGAKRPPSNGKQRCFPFRLLIARKWWWRTFSAIHCMRRISARILERLFVGLGKVIKVTGTIMIYSYGCSAISCRVEGQKLRCVGPLYYPTPIVWLWMTGTSKDFLIMRSRRGGPVKGHRIKRGNLSFTWMEEINASLAELRHSNQVCFYWLMSEIV